jgi:hypothetical protein
MLAIVLSCDKYHPLTDHMISCYVRKWPSNPFVFRVPYQEFPQSLAWKFGSKIELVRTPRNIKKTVLSLLSDLDEDEWIYWCIDDKYLVEIDEAAANKSLEWIGQLDNPMDCGIMFCRCRKLLDNENLRLGTNVISPFGQEYIQRKNYYQFWIPQFMRAGVLRALFKEFPDSEFVAKDMDTFTGQEEWLSVKVSIKNYACFGESTMAGMLTQNCSSSLVEAGIDAPGFRVSSHEIFMGRL